MDEVTEERMKCQYERGFYQQPDRSNDLIFLRKKSTAGRMVPFHYGHGIHPPTMITRFGYRSEYNKCMVHHHGPWACDYCQVATFQTFAEAEIHEHTCPMNQNVLKTQSQVSSHNSYESQDFTTTVQSFGLSMPGDKDSLSDRQCYVRSHFVELFTASDTDVASRHSKGAQKLSVGQIGIRCKHCVNLRSKDRAERAICYPSSISRIYQTVADMQRFHFDACSSIPSEMKSLYKNLKTTRPRGVGSPQTYWISSANQLGLVDSDEGIRFESARDHLQHPQLHPSVEVSSTSSRSSCSSNKDMDISPRRLNYASSPLMMQSAALTPLSPESQSTSISTSHDQSDISDYETSDRDCEASMLLALKNIRTDCSGPKLQSDHQ